MQVNPNHSTEPHGELVFALKDLIQSLHALLQSEEDPINRVEAARAVGQLQRQMCLAHKALIEPFQLGMHVMLGMHSLFLTS